MDRAEVKLIHTKTSNSSQLKRNINKKFKFIKQILISHKKPRCSTGVEEKQLGFARARTFGVLVTAQLNF